MKLSDKHASKTQRILIYGSPKTGKTQLAGEMAEHGYKLYWFDLENGSNTLLKLSPAAQDNVELYSLPDTSSYPIGIETILKVIKGGEHSICQQHGKVSCPKCKIANLSFASIDLNTLGTKDILVIDSLTQLTSSAIASIVRGQPDDYKLDYNDWGNLGKLMGIVLSHIEQANFNVICISHETETEMEDGKVKIVPTAGTRNFSRNTAKYFDHVIYAEVKNKKHMFGSATDYGMSMVTGSRTDVKIEKEQVSSLLPFFTGQMLEAASKVNSQGLVALGNISKLTT